MTLPLGPGARVAARRWMMGLVALAAVGTSACILPDREIQVIREDENGAAVRIIEPAPQSPQVRCACDGPCEDLTPEEQEDLTCPVPQESGFPHFLDPNDERWQFCSCREGRIDARAINNGVTIFVEDQDAEDNEPKDELFAALLLDLPQGANPVDYVAYRQALDPASPLPNFPTTYETDVILRPPPRVRQVLLSDVSTTTFDLCNGAGGGFQPEPGFHTLTLIVTDRPWFTVADQQISQPGVVDFIAGATYDTTTFVFRCLEDDPDNPDNGCECQDPDADE